MLGESLVGQGIVSREALAQAQEHANRFGGALEDSLVRLKLAPERDVLRTLARELNMQFLTAEKASQLKVADELLERVPVRLCETHRLFPFRLEPAGALWVIADARPEAKVEDELRIVTGAGAVNAILARTATVHAAIRRHYYRDLGAFEALDDPTPPPLLRKHDALPEVASVKSEVPSEPHMVRALGGSAHGVEALEREVERLRVAQAFFVSIAELRELGELMNKILATLFDLFTADAGAFVLTDPAGRPEIIEARRRDGGPTGDLVLSETMLSTVVTEGRGLLTADATADARLASAESVIARNVKAAMCVPMLTPQKVLGALYLETRDVGAFGTRDLEMLSALGAQAALAVDNTMLAQQIEREVSTRLGLARFLSPALVEQVATNGLKLDKGGQLTTCTVLFADVRGFTPLAEQRSAQEVVRFLNEHFEAMVDVVFAHGGVLDKFIGDGLMALWGAPVRKTDDARQAVLAAREMVESCAQRRAAGFDAPQIGVGVATGPVVVGGIGSTKRLEYTAIGDTVNIASRLCDLAPPGHVLVSDATAGLAGEGLSFERLPETAVKGKRQPVRVFRLS